MIPKGKKVIGDREIPAEEIAWNNFRNWGGESRREDAKNCFYPVIVENGEVVEFGDVLDDDNILLVKPRHTEKEILCTRLIRT